MDGNLLDISSPTWISILEPNHYIEKQRLDIVVSDSSYQLNVYGGEIKSRLDLHLACFVHVSIYPWRTATYDRQIQDVMCQGWWNSALDHVSLRKNSTRVSEMQVGRRLRSVSFITKAAPRGNSCNCLSFGSSPGVVFTTSLQSLARSLLTQYSVYCIHL